VQVQAKNAKLGQADKQICDKVICFRGRIFVRKSLFDLIRRTLAPTIDDRVADNLAGVDLLSQPKYRSLEEMELAGISNNNTPTVALSLALLDTPATQPSGPRFGGGVGVHGGGGGGFRSVSPGRGGGFHGGVGVHGGVRGPVVRGGGGFGAGLFLGGLAAGALAPRYYGYPYGYYGYNYGGNRCIRWDPLLQRYVNIC
jgi:hypothetical protein